MVYSNKNSLFSLFFIIFLAQFIISGLSVETAEAQVQPQDETLRVAVAGTPPFVVQNGESTEGISVEIWRDLAAQLGLNFESKLYPSVPEALEALNNNDVDAVVGPTSISSERAKQFEFTQPYFQSSLSILSSKVEPGVWQRIAPFFSKAFFAALGILLVLLFIVGVVMWLVEHRHEDSDFPDTPLRGIANGMWFAIVTMTTVGYGDIAPRTRIGRVVTASWMLISIVAATSLVAGIASSLTLSGSTVRTISKAEEMYGKNVAVLADSPAQEFAESYGANIKTFTSLQEGYNLLKKQEADAVVFDRPQLLYFTQENYNPDVRVSRSKYLSQGYGFVFPLGSPLVNDANVELLELDETGRIDQIVDMWLNKESNI